MNFRALTAAKRIVALTGCDPLHTNGIARIIDQIPNDDKARLDRLNAAMFGGEDSQGPRVLDGWANFSDARHLIDAKCPAT